MALAAVSLEFRYGRGWRLGPVDLEIPGGSVVGLVGPNGAGKTTLMRLLAGFLRPAAGHIRLNGTPVSKREQLLAAVQWVSADPVYPRGNTIRDLCEFCFARAGWDRATRRDLAEQVERRMGRPLTVLPDQLSRGQRVILALELACAVPKSALLVDEPWANLDPLNRERVRATMAGLAQQGVAVMVSSHDLLALPTLARRFCFLVDGKVRWEGELPPDLQPGEAFPARAASQLLELFKQTVAGGQP